MTKRCSICKQDKAIDPDNPKLSEFAKDKSRRDGFQNKCKLCQKELSAKHYQEHTESYFERLSKSRDELRRKIYDLKEASSCVDCKRFYPFYVMQYDHIGSDKIASVNSLLRLNGNLDRILAEIAKCELVCANCHAGRTWRRSTQQGS